MVKFLLASHGTFCEGTLSFLKIMMGVPENLYVMSAFLDDEPVGKKVEETLHEIGEFDQLIIFCDIHGGSVQQELFRQTQTDGRNIQIISGYNLPLIMDIIIKNQVLSEDEIRQSIQESKEAIVYTKDFCIDDAEDDLF